MPSDAHLVASVRARDARALREVYDLYGDRVYSFAVRLTGQRHAADELFQHAWVTLAEHAPRLAADTNLLAWLLTVARNHWRSQHRRASTRNRHQEALRPDAPAPGPDVAAERRAAMARLEAALGELAEHHREVLVLVVEAGDVPQHELAAVLQISPPAFRKRLSRARQALHALLHPEDADG